MDNFRILFLLFTIYSFIGWLTESIFCSIPAGKFINRGFLNGPFCPIYGVGGIAVVYVLSPFQHNIIALYAAGVLITTLIEYITGLALELVFHTKYWDYTDQKFNIQGRICLQNSLLFGVMCVVGMLYVQPLLMRLLLSIPTPVLPFFSGGFTVYFVCDTVITVHAILQLNGKLSELQQILDEIKERASAATTGKFENLQAAIGNLIDEDTKAYLYSLFEKKDKIETENKLLQRRIIKAFPTMKSIRNNESLQRIKEAIQNKAKGIKRG